jgi:small subunit ribosomal protein S7
MAQKRSTFIPEGSNPLQEKFINYIMKEGKKNIARKIFKDTLNVLTEKGQKEPAKVFERAVENVKPTLEIRPKRIGGAVYQIPIEVKPGRQLMLSFRWILDSARGKKGQPMAKKLAEELLNASNNEGNAIKKKEDTIKMAQANKAFAHYAKY